MNFTPSIHDLEWPSLLEKSAATADAYAGDLRQILRSLTVILRREATAGDVLELTTKAVAQLVKAWLRQGLSPATVRRRLVSLRRYGRDLATRVGAVGPLLYARGNG